MKHNVENKTLTIFLEGELNSFTSSDVEQEIESLLKSNDLESIVLDLKELTYISSAGLRIIVRIKQLYDDTTLVNVPDGVFDVLQMVGFQNLIKIVR